MSNQNLRLSEFELKGKFLGFVRKKSGKLKHLHLAIASGNLKIKLPKKLRSRESLCFAPGEEIRVLGVRKQKVNRGRNKRRIKLKAKQIQPANFFSKQQVNEKYKAKILICQKSRCLKRGGKNLVSKLEKTLCEQGLQDQVIIKSSHCLKRCSKAPSCVLEMAAQKYSEVHPAHPNKITYLLKKYVSS